MSSPHFAVVVKADGSVPFDKDVHPDHKRHMIGMLVEAGHAVKTRDDGSVYIDGWKKP